MTNAPVSLEDKYVEDRGPVYLSGLQTLVRALINQSRRDRHAGLSTGGFVSGYRGSPLGTFDRELWRAAKHLTPAGIRFVPGVNEELAAGAVAGTQQLAFIPASRHDGVFAMWYGKGPGVDRCGDVFRHGNLAGTASKGGVLVLCGDDHGGVSTTTTHQSDFTLKALHIPLLLPASVQDVLDLSAHGWAISRFTGLYVGLKALTETIETSTVVDPDPWRARVVIPEDIQLQPGEPSIRWPDDRWSQERRLFEHKLPALTAYVRANGLNPVVLTHAGARLGLIASGKAYLDVRQALADFGLGPPELLRLGLRILKIQVPWPLDATAMLDFASGLEEILVVEEKEPLIEPQLREILYSAPAGRRPRVIGKPSAGASGTRQPQTIVLPVASDLDVATVSHAVGSWLLQYDDLPAVRKRIEQLNAKEAAVLRTPTTQIRAPYYCSGCPHNTSTKVPEGSLALAGVGCHYLGLFIYPERTKTFSVMGLEGSNWVGLAPFTETSHVFVNLGDGTYFHSGILAIRQSVAAGVNVTYRILYNDAVAMTGGQPVDGTLTVPALVAQLEAEGVSKVIVVAEELELQRSALRLPGDTALRPRTQLDAVQQELRGFPGCTALIYVQTCAAEKRRRRKRAEFPDPPRRVYIHPEVCEGCGDCGQRSNCVSVVPRPTTLGTKRAIDQSSCNKDFSCLDGFCPSFITVAGGNRRTTPVLATGGPTTPLPDPVPPPLASAAYNVLITGIGGTGVITIGALIGMAARIEGKSVTVMDMTGMAQKNGGVQSHVRIAATPEALGSSKIPAAAADLLIACDWLEAAGPDALRRLAHARTRVVANSDVVMPGSFAQRPEEASVSADALRAILLEHIDREHLHSVAATTLATALFGDPVATNVFMLGIACQLGWVPLGVESLERALELNGVAVETNKAALHWGRHAAADPGAVRRLASPEAQRLPAAADHPDKPDSPEKELARILDDRRGRLAQYGSPSYPRRYLELVRLAEEAERSASPTSLAFTTAVARQFYKLLAVKDEFEVARLLVQTPFLRELESSYEGRYRIKFHLAPPILARWGMHKRAPVKRTFGPWIRIPLHLLARARRWRGTLLDPFRSTAERALDRRLLEDYERLVRELCRELEPSTLGIAVQLASLPDRIRGFGHVREASALAVEADKRTLLARFAKARAAEAAQSIAGQSVGRSADTP
ncbi:MAG: indolepyruvate ferredoxin oxidoreductase family protein [Steroidobacteraceae bacterium]